VTTILLIVLGFLMSGFFSGSETALVSMNWIRLEHWLEKGRRGARALERFVGDPQKLLGTTLVGTNIAVIMTSSLVSWKLDHTLETWPPGLVGLLSTASVTILMLVFGEIVPKVWGLRHSDSVTLKVIHPLRVFYWIFSPVIFLASGAATLVLKPAGVETRRWRRRMTKDQLRFLLTSEGELSGAVDREETKLISGIFEFALTTVEEVMVPRVDVIGLGPEATVGDAVKLVERHGFSRLPVFTEERDRIVGMIHSKDLLGVPRAISVGGFVRPMPHVPETKMCDELFRELQARRQHMAVVVDEHGSVAGIVTLEDLIEELTGEIEDEYDIRLAPIRKLDNDLFMIDGRAELDAVEDALEVDLPEGEYNTLAGLLLEELGRIPEPGEEIVLAGLEFRIISASATRIGKIRVRKRWNKHKSGT
jgi:CBS domain containing-hemolysin-like protein